MTSNLGSQRILEAQGSRDANQERIKQLVMDEVRAHFRPEFLNRVDEIIVFHALTRDDLKKIVQIQLARLNERLMDRHLTLELTAAAIDFLVETGYSPTYGARPLKRLVQKEIENRLARQLLEGKVRDGQTVVVDYDTQRKELTLSANR